MNFWANLRVKEGQNTEKIESPDEFSIGKIQHGIYDLYSFNIVGSVKQ